MEKHGPYCVIGGAPSKIKLPLPIEWLPGIGAPRQNQGRRFQFCKKKCQKKHVGVENRKIRRWGPLVNSARILDVREL
jgi:hypothetical protein